MERKYIKKIKEKLKCDICKAEFTPKGFKAHMQIHAENRVKYSCELCDKTFLTQTSLKLHLEWHDNPDQRFSCKICKKQFTRLTNLKTHTKTHNLS